ncbi:ComF family protein [Actinokineospora sp. UTMC 2448]|uniref:ComF family protein n=1 Tax=Actinokineospora sp. UTMC 2448 TaxID=2268449 RepID=UPI0021641DD0|nr:phosphoribosyltransferase [Actinokineospora sp. UTMC 2448]UVS81239.1 DNA utilization protein GntX [Actinokineospora sp. UTMC 2448]
MPDVSPLSPQVVQGVRQAVRNRVGAFFRNSVWIRNRTCAVCAIPIESKYTLCYQCNEAYSTWGSQIADQVLVVAYAYRRCGEHRSTRGRHQSEQHMWSYKANYPGPGCVTDLTTMLAVALRWHRGCAEAGVGSPWTAWTCVPSGRHSRVGEHPLLRLCLKAGLGSSSFSNPPLPYVGLTARSSIFDRRVLQGMFSVDAPHLVAGRHVLVVEDTWVTGSSAQSAALALKQAGAAAVTIVCLARWLREDGPASAAEFFVALLDPYDPLRCPVNSSRCFAQQPR